jgi:microcystin-dependent protein
MSNIALVSPATGTATFSITTPSGTSTDRTLTLPDVSGTVALQGGAGVGKVLQVVNATYGTETSTSSASYIDTGLTASITPTSATSKVLVFVDMTGIGATAASQRSNMAIVRNSTNILEFEKEAPYTTMTSEFGLGGVGATYLDSPATTSATTYKIQIKATAGTVFWNLKSGNSTITIMEIAA